METSVKATDYPKTIKKNRETMHCNTNSTKAIHALTKINMSIL